MSSVARSRAAKPISFAEFRDEILFRYRGNKPSTIQKVRQVLDILSRTAGLRDTGDLTVAAVNRFLATWGGDSEPTREGLLRAFRRLCNIAVAERWLARSPFDESPELAPPSFSWKGPVLPRGIDLDESQLGQILHAFQTVAGTSWRERRRRLLVATIAQTGILLDVEALELSRGDFDPGRRILKIGRRRRLTASAHPQVVPISPELAEEYERWLRDDNRTDWVFPNLLLTGRWQAKSGPLGQRPRNEIRAAGEAAGISNLTANALRRYYLRHARNPGPAPIPAILRPGIAARRDIPSSPPIRIETVVSPQPAVPTPGIEQLDNCGIHAMHAIALSIDGATRLMARLKLNSDTWEKHRSYTVITVVLLSDLSKDQAVRLRVAEVDIAGQMFRPAGQLPVSMSAELAQVLDDWLPRVEPLTEWVFPGTRLQGPWTGGTHGRTLRAFLQAEAAAAGCGHVTFYDLKALRRKEGGRVELGDDYHRLSPPERPPTPPMPRKPGPAPGTKPATSRFDWARKATIPIAVPAEASMAPPSANRPGEANPWDHWDANASPGHVREDGHLIIFGRDKGLIRSRPARDLFGKLAAAYPGGFTMAQLLKERIAGDFRGIMTRWREKDADCLAAIQLPGVKNGGLYRFGRPD